MPVVSAGRPRRVLNLLPGPPLLWLAGSCVWAAAWFVAPAMPGAGRLGFGENATAAAPTMAASVASPSTTGMMLESLQGAMVVARQSLALGRSQGDERHYAAARAALAPWWQQERPPAELLLLRAILRQHDHQFNQALADLEQLLARAPDNAQAWLTRTVVLRELGEYDRALASCLPLLRLASTLVATTCTSNVASRLGRARDSYTALHRALADSAREAPLERVWALTTLAEIAAGLGWRARAELHFRQALAFAPGDAETLAAYTEFRQGRELGLLQGHGGQQGQAPTE